MSASPNGSSRWANGLVAGAILGATAFFAAYLWMHQPGSAEREARLLRDALSRLTAEDRVAQVLVLSQEPSAAGKPQTTLLFQEVTPAGVSGATRAVSLPAQRLTVPGDEVYFDSLVIRFKLDHVAAGDQLRGRSVHLFRRVFAAGQAPEDGPQLEALADGVPVRYLAGSATGLDADLALFQRQLWQRFWDYARDGELAKRQGVDVAQGVAVSQRLRAGELWELTLRRSGELSLRHVPLAPDVARLMIERAMADAPKP